MRREHKPVALIVLSWAGILFSAFIINQSIAALSQMCYYYPSPLPIKIQEILNNLQAMFAIIFISLSVTLLAAVLMFSGALAALNQKAWGFKLFIAACSLDIVKRLSLGVIGAMRQIPAGFPYWLLSELILVAGFIVYLHKNKGVATTWSTSKNSA